MGKFKLLTAIALCAAVTVPGMADEIKVLPGSSGWTRTGSAYVTGTVGRSGDGSLELKGDQTRFSYGKTSGISRLSPQLFSAESVTGLTFDWMIAGDSVNKLGDYYTPALRLFVWDAGAKSSKELIWEGAYNKIDGVPIYNNPDVNRDQWYTTTLDDTFYLRGGNENAGQTIADWLGGMAAGSFIAGVNVGAGSSAGVGYHAFADNVTIHLQNGSSTTWNFEATPNAAVPEPASWAMMIGGLALVGATMRRRRISVQFG